MYGILLATCSLASGLCSVSALDLGQHYFPDRPTCEEHVSKTGILYDPETNTVSVGRCSRAERS